MSKHIYYLQWVVLKPGTERNGTNGTVAETKLGPISVYRPM